MKTFLTLFVYVAAAALVHAGFELKSGTFRMDQFEEALAKAKAENKPITILDSDEKTTCPLCSNASVEAMKTMSRDTIIVYTKGSNKAEWAALPRQVKLALVAPEAGKFIPKAVVFNPELDTQLASIPYARGKDYDKNLREARTKIAATGKSGTGAKTTAQSSDAEAAPAGSRVWTDLKGRTVEGSVYSKSGSSIRLRTASGIVTVAIDQLSPEDQAFLGK